MHPEHEPQLSVKIELRIRLEKLLRGDEPLSKILEIRGTLISQLDLLPVLDGFRRQRRLFERFHSRWPAVPGFLKSKSNDIDSVVTIPLDLRTSANEKIPTVSDSTARDWLDSHIAQRRASARQSGLQVEDFSTAEMTDAFVEPLSDTLIRRTTKNADANGGPPTDLFTVTTDSAGVEVLFAQGVFLSTGEGFGISTPARRSLPWGYYMFGARIGAKVDFSSATVWKVPEVTATHLKV